MTNRRLDRFAPLLKVPLAKRGEPRGCGTPRFARETETRACSVPPASRGNLKEGVSRKITLQEVCYRKR